MIQVIKWYLQGFLPFFLLNLSVRGWRAVRLRICDQQRHELHQGQAGLIVYIESSGMRN